MANIDLNDANNDGTGIDVLEYFSTWETTFVREYWGFFSDSATDFVGRQFAFADSAATTVGTVGSADTVVVDSGTANGLQYDYTNHVLAGAVDGVTFGSGLGYSSTSDTFSQSTWDIDISGLGVTGSGADNAVHNIVWQLMNSNTATLISTLNGQNNTFTGSDGDDTLYSFNGNDTFTGSDGLDIFVFDLAGFGYETFTSIGDDTVTDFDAASELIYIGVTGYDSYADLSISGTTDAVIDLGTYGSITLTGVSASSLTADNFAFV